MNKDLWTKFFSSSTKVIITITFFVLFRCFWSKNRELRQECVLFGPTRILFSNRKWSPHCAHTLYDDGNKLGNDEIDVQMRRMSTRERAFELILPASAKRHALNFVQFENASESVYFGCTARAVFVSYSRVAEGERQCLMKCAFVETHAFTVTKCHQVFCRISFCVVHSRLDAKLAERWLWTCTHVEFRCRATLETGNIRHVMF